MNKTSRAISSLAVLKVLWDHYKKDYIENFVPFIATLINRKDYKEIRIEQICKDFEEEFGLKIPYYPMITILNRATKRKIIKKQFGKFVPVKDNLINYDFTDVSRKQISKQNEVLRKFKEFCKEQYDEDITDEQAEKSFISYLKNHDLEILFATQEKSSLPNVTSSKHELFLINKFIEYTYETGSDIFDFIVEIAIGHILANAIFYNMELKKFEGKLKNIHFYFDTRFILRLSGVEGEARKKAYSDFIKILNQQEAALFIFEHTYEEISGILERCRKWINNPGYDPSKASITLKYFIEQGYTESDIDRFLSIKFPGTLSLYSIKVIEPPDPDQYRHYQIDEIKLHDYIADIYNIEEWEKDFTIQKDINSISAINRLRRNGRPRSIREAKYLFITTNSALAFANRKFEISQLNNGNDFWIPACSTDVFIGTLIWLQSPSKTLDINKRKIIADAYAALQPDNTFLKKLVSESERLMKDGKISEKESYVLRTYVIARNLLMEKTKGEPDNFNEYTLLEILEEIKREGSKEFEEKYLLERKKRKDTEEKLEKEEVFKQIVEKRVNKLSKTISWVVSGILLLAMGWGYWKKFDFIILLFAILNIVFGFNIMGLKDKMENKIKEKLLK